MQGTTTLRKNILIFLSHLTLNRSAFTTVLAEVGKKFQSSVKTEPTLVLCNRADTNYSTPICKCKAILWCGLNLTPRKFLW